MANVLRHWQDEPPLEVVQGRPWTFFGDAAVFRLVSEHRLVLTSLVEPFPQQMTTTGSSSPLRTSRNSSVELGTTRGLHVALLFAKAVGAP